MAAWVVVSGSTTNYTADALCALQGQGKQLWTSGSHVLGSEAWISQGTMSASSWSAPGVVSASGNIVGSNVKAGCTAITASTTTAIPNNVQCVVTTLSSGLTWAPITGGTSTGLPIDFIFIQPSSGTAATVTYPATLLGFDQPSATLGSRTSMHSVNLNNVGGITAWVQVGASKNF